MEKQCFVIMPYGSNDSEKKAYGRLYNFLIKTAVEEIGLKCIRSDFEGKGGHILGNVIEDLSASQIVIADLSAMNWNVAYELGMRHVLRKNGTILICNSAYKDVLPFDVRSLNIFFYPEDWLDSFEELRDSLKQSIDGRISGKTQNDSPVHEKYTFLPESIIEGFSEKAEDQLKAANARVAQLEKELTETHKKIESMGLSISGEAANNTDYSQLFISELENSIYNSDRAVARLREFIENEQKEEFLDFLGKVLSVGFLDEVDCRIIYTLCKKLNVPSITRKYLETVTKFYPDNEELSGLLANEYSINYHTGEKALQMVNNIIGVTKKDDRFLLSKTSHVTPNKLASFFDVYQHLHKYLELIEIGKLLQERFNDNLKILPLILRNITSAYLRLDDLENAKCYKEQLEAIAPLSDLTHWICSSYENASENYPKALEEIEKCIALDNTDTDYYITMAGRICDNLYARDPESLIIKKITSKEADQYAIPFLLTALSLDHSAISQVIDFLRRNKFNEYIAPLIDAYQSDVTNFSKVFKEFNFVAVDYCVNLTL